MQLRQAKPLGVFNHHHRGVRNIHTHLNHGGGDENVNFSRGKARHYGFFFFCGEFAVQ